MIEMPIQLCKLCQREGIPKAQSMINHEDMQQHMLKAHAMTQEQATLYMIAKTEDQVKYVLSRYADEFNSNGWLLKRIFQLFPFRSARYIYDPMHEEHALAARSEDDLAYALKHAESITRIGRALRAQLREKQGIDSASDWKAAQRAMQAEWSTSYWGGQKVADWLPNTYVPMRD